MVFFRACIARNPLLGRFNCGLSRRLGVTLGFRHMVCMRYDMRYWGRVQLSTPFVVLFDSVVYAGS